jgi:hypothetical protein
MIVAKSKEVKTRWTNSTSAAESSKERYGSKMAVLPTTRVMINTR